MIRQVLVRNLWGWLLVACLVGSLVQGGGGPENVLVVVNAESWSSRSLANEYMALRSIPASNRVELEGIGIEETIGVEDFRKQILVPILRYLEQASLTAQIDYIAYSSDFPYRVDISADALGRDLPKQIGRSASLTGLTYLYQSVLLKRLDYLELNANWYALPPFEREVDPPWGKADREIYGKVQGFFLEKRAREADKKEPADEDKAWEREKWTESVAYLRDLLERHPDSLEVRYNLACGLSVLGQVDEAMAELRKTVDKGWANWAIAMAARGGWLDYTDMAKDEDFTALREREDFKALLAEVANERVYMPPARAFDASAGWTVTGQRCAPYQGARYLLATMLGYTGGRGNSYAETLRYLARAQAADGTRPGGTVYYMENSDVRSTCREWAMRGAVARLQENGIKGAIEHGILPDGKPDVIGLMVGAANFDWEKSGSVLMPGAICEHLTSLGGVMSENGGQTPLSAFLAAGAAGASGTVAEPYAIQGKFPNAFLQAYYTEGCSLAEAFYQSVTGPYQLLIVGDPLCQPWAQPPVVTVEGLAPNQVVKGDVPIKFTIAEPGVPALGLHLFLDGRRFAAMPVVGEFTLPADKLSDGQHELRVVAVAASSTQAQGRAVIPFLVANHEREDFALLELPAKEVSYGERLSIEADIPDAKEVDIFQGPRRLASIDSGTGTLQIDTTLLGMGPVELRYGIVLADGETRISGVPLSLRVLPPPALSLDAAQVPAKTVAGLQLLVKNGDEKNDATIATLKGDWLAQSGVKEGSSFALRGYFDVPEEGLYQFQFQGNLLGSCRVKVDDELQAIPDGESWRALVVSLTKGTHSLTLSGRGEDKPRLDIRFGGPGCRTVDDKRFRRGVAE